MVRVSAMNRASAVEGGVGGVGIVVVGGRGIGVEIVGGE